MLIEIILGERPHPTPLNETQEPIRYFDRLETLQLTVDGQTVSEPIAPLRERFAKLKARDALLGAVLARLGADPGARETEAHNAVGRLLASREDVSKIADRYVKAAEEIAQGLGLSATKPDELAAQVLAMNTELSSALSSSQAEVKALIEENARLRAEVEQERRQKLVGRVAIDSMASWLAERETEIASLKLSLEVRELERVLACARVTGLAAELQALEVAMREKLRT